MSNRKKKNINGNEKVHVDNSLMDSLGKNNVLPDGLLFSIDNTQSINRKLDLESLEEPLDF